MPLDTGPNAPRVFTLTREYTHGCSDVINLGVFSTLEKAQRAVPAPPVAPPVLQRFECFRIESVVLDATWVVAGEPSWILRLGAKQWKKERS